MITLTPEMIEDIRNVRLEYIKKFNYYCDDEEVSTVIRYRKEKERLNKRRKDK